MKKIGAFIILIAICLSMTGCVKLNDDEKRVANAVENLKDMMKDPDSFILRGDILLIDDGDDSFYYIESSANNSFGASVRSVSIMLELIGTYICDVDETDFDSLGYPFSEYGEKAVSLYDNWRFDRLEKNVFTETYDGEKIAKYLKLEYRD